jgi:hypothetical protein
VQAGVDLHTDLLAPHKAYYRHAVDFDRKTPTRPAEPIPNDPSDDEPRQFTGRS